MFVSLCAAPWIVLVVVGVNGFVEDDALFVVCLSFVSSEPLVFCGVCWAGGPIFALVVEVGADRVVYGLGTCFVVCVDDASGLDVWLLCAAHASLR